MRVFGLVRILGWQFYVGAENIWVAVLAWGDRRCGYFGW